MMFLRNCKTKKNLLRLFSIRVYITDKPHRSWIIIPRHNVLILYFCSGLQRSQGMVFQPSPELKSNNLAAFWKLSDQGKRVRCKFFLRFLAALMLRHWKIKIFNSCFSVLVVLLCVKMVIQLVHLAFPCFIFRLLIFSCVSELCLFN